MMELWGVVLALAVVSVLALALLATLVVTRSRTARELATAQAERAQLRAAIEELERRLAAPGADQTRQPAEFQITRLGEPAPNPPAEPIDRALFADLVLRETVVKTAALAHGVRRALAPETRNRIRFEVRREIKRARKQRRADLREAVREWEARQRADVDDESSEHHAGDGDAA